MTTAEDARALPMLRLIDALAQAAAEDFIAEERARIDAQAAEAFPADDVAA